MVRTLLIDVDGVLADFTSMYLAVLEQVTGRRHTQEEIISWHYSECIATPAEDAKVWQKIAASPELVSELEEYPGTQAFLEKARKNYRVVAVTSPAWDCPGWMPSRADWLRRRGFKTQDIIFCTDKSLIKGDVFIDDRAENVHAWSVENSLDVTDRGWFPTAFLVQRPWNHNANRFRYTMEWIASLL